MRIGINHDDQITLVRARNSPTLLSICPSSACISIYAYIILLILKIKIKKKKMNTHVMFLYN